MHVEYEGSLGDVVFILAMLGFQALTLVLIARGSRLAWRALLIYTLLLTAAFLPLAPSYTPPYGVVAVAISLAQVGLLLMPPIRRLVSPKQPGNAPNGEPGLPG